MLSTQLLPRCYIHPSTAAVLALQSRDISYYDCVLQQWVDSMAAAVGPFITDHAGRFAQELVGFLSSNLSIAGHDHLVFGVDETPNLSPQRLQSGIGQTANASPLLFQTASCTASSCYCAATYVLSLHAAVLVHGCSKFAADILIVSI